MATLAQKIENLQHSLTVETSFDEYNTTWTRGDGSRYKEPAKLNASTRSDISIVWAEIQEFYPSAKHLSVKGEFGSDSFEPAIISNGVLFINRGVYIQISTPSILKNEVVWASKG